jgi:hypothetical protein
MSAELNNKIDYMYEMIFCEPLDCRGPIDLGDQLMPENPVREFLAKQEDEVSKANAVAVEWPEDLAKIVGFEDIAEPRLLSKNSMDAAWDEPIGAAARIQLSKGFLKRSDARFQSVAAKIRSIFGEHEEEAQEAIEMAKDVRDAERQAFVAA